MATKTEIVIRIMKDNQGKAMADVLPLLMAEFGWTEKNARAAYALRVKADPSLGTVQKAARAAAPKAAKAAKGPKLVKVPKPKVQGDKPKVTDKTVEELQDIRNKNLARLKAVGRKYMKGQIAEPEAAGVPNFDAAEARQYVEDVTNDLDSFKSPRFLTMDAVKVLV